MLANLVCMGFYVAGPFFNLGTKMEPLTALGISAVWGLYGAIYFLRSSKAKGKTVLLESKNVSVKQRRLVDTNRKLGGIPYRFFTKAAHGNTTQ